MNEVAHTLVRVKEPATDSVLEWPSSSIGERRRLRISALLDKHARLDLPLEIDAASIETRGRAGLETTHLETQTPD